MPILSNTSGLSLGSHTQVNVECDLKVSDKCRGQYEMAYKDTVTYRAKHDGKIVCVYCTRASTPDSMNDGEFMTNIDTEGKAYLLGWIACNGAVKQNESVSITVETFDQSILNTLRDIVSPDISIVTKNNSETVSITFNSNQMSADVARHLQISGDQTVNNSTFPQFKTNALALAFIRGLFDGNLGSVFQGPSGSVGAILTCNTHEMVKKIGEIIDVPHALRLNKSAIEWSGVNTLDFLGKIYDGSTYHLTRKYNRYMDLCVWCPAAVGQDTGLDRDDPTFAVLRTSPDAVIPSKSRASDSGYDLTIVKTVKPFGPLTTLYDTCIKVRPPAGFYMDVVPRSSLSKSGYMIANCVGIIDRAYTGSIMIALVKVDPSAPDIQLPFCGFQMIPRPIVHFQVVEVTSDMLEDTGRGAGGFGSTEEKAAIAAAKINGTTTQ
eukprot:gene3349-4200_t